MNTLEKCNDFISRCVSVYLFVVDVKEHAGTKGMVSTWMIWILRGLRLSGLSLLFPSSPALVFVQSSILGLKVFQQCGVGVWMCFLCLCACVCFGAGGGFMLVDSFVFWQRKLPSEWDSKRPTRQGMSARIGPGNIKFACVCVNEERCGCKCLCMSSWLWTQTPYYKLPCVRCLLTNFVTAVL